MADRCQLEEIPMDLLSREGVAWDTALPEGCIPCVNQALGSSACVSEFFTPNLDPDEDFDLLDKYLCRGVKSLPNGRRVATEETGIDSGGVNHSNLISRSTIEFTCRMYN